MNHIKKRSIKKQICDIYIIKQNMGINVKSIKLDFYYEKYNNININI